eukprot:scpid72226/ scgid6591/ 
MPSSAGVFGVNACRMRLSCDVRRCRGFRSPSPAGFATVSSNTGFRTMLEWPVDKASSGNSSPQSFTKSLAFMLTCEPCHDREVQTSTVASCFSTRHLTMIMCLCHAHVPLAIHRKHPQSACGFPGGSLAVLCSNKQACIYVLRSIYFTDTHSYAAHTYFDSCSSPTQVLDAPPGAPGSQIQPAYLFRYPGMAGNGDSRHPIDSNVRQFELVAGCHPYSEVLRR